MDSVLQALHRNADHVSRWGANAGGLLLLAAALIIAFEVIARKLFNYSLVGADELAGYAFGISMAWGFAYVLFRRSHLRVDALYNQLPATVCRWLDVISLFCFLLFIGLLTFRSYLIVHESIVRDVKASTPLSTPLWIPQIPWFLGLCFFTFCLSIVLVRTCLALKRGDYGLIRDIASAPSVNDEIAESGAQLEKAASNRK